MLGVYAVLVLRSEHFRRAILIGGGKEQHVGGWVAAWVERCGEGRRRELFYGCVDGRMHGWFTSRVGGCLDDRRRGVWMRPNAAADPTWYAHASLTDLEDVKTTSALVTRAQE